MAIPGKNVFFQGFYLDWPLYRGILCLGRGKSNIDSVFSGVLPGLATL